MRVVVNGEERELAEGASLEELVAALGLAETPCAAEVNKRLVPKRERGETTLSEGDVIELVTLVGGG